MDLLELDDESTLPCEVCGSLIFIQELVEHQLSCEQDNILDADEEIELEMIERELASLQEARRSSSSKKKAKRYNVSLFIQSLY
jgi:hypothetical protein